MADFDKLMAECSAAKDAIIGWRRHLHAHPELSFEEHETVAYIRSVLEGFGCAALSMSNPVPTALVADLVGGAGAGPIIALRADIDALPLHEETDVPFKSQRANVMHACGHDTHTAMLLGAAKVLCAHAAEISGTVRLMFQHAEEKPPGGASELVKLDVMEGVKYVFGMHCTPELPVGQVATKNGALSSNADQFSIWVRGRGGHASTPQLLVDPVPIAAEVVTALQTIVARKVDPKVAPVVSIPTMTTGPNESHNVIPDEVKLLGTVRSQDMDVRAKVPVLIEQVVKGITAAHGAEYKMEYLYGYTAVMNDPAVTDVARKMARRALGSDTAVEELAHARFGGEDFSAYQLKAPGCFMRIGCTDPSLDAPKAPGLHTCRLNVDDRTLSVGARVHTAFVYHYLMSGGGEDA
ncbi:putative Aminoacylase putativen-acyl-l-amino acid amidohydrolase [Leptomonas pyrrhocoris]|uniref:Putative Aminoacylase putativen-acyl-l-amino acid amidohydrolase n=1 Tax=Leptomonas pyrrhocoris TaxID=157538 RepID=A0A0M9FTF2_LEPPY|nr:putative Aminoacylase putativen-acyl-l-amino acid amidohydrolase [Leptomonas pyrrhocoris]KPA75705.1 putative Aminoacylase putativen-acyl-l-amino acid amidohydrolase [Leptomonas pyrrhocoris]|eukprot:XP_015654144.1 putative Aminoacylase putativen-acyl-l-amino acid amidohydrolase [Leptomonas pyrrhocoris]